MTSCASVLMKDAWNRVTNAVSPFGSLVYFFIYLEVLQGVFRKTATYFHFQEFYVFLFLYNRKEYTQNLLHAWGTGILDLKRDKISDPFTEIKGREWLGFLGWREVVLLWGGCRIYTVSQGCHLPRKSPREQPLQWSLPGFSVFFSGMVSWYHNVL